jgi:MbtH protein
MADQDTVTTLHVVVVNNEEQYSVWEASDPVPRGWDATGFTGTREQCLAHIEHVWTDMRPLSLRVEMDKR